MDEIDRIRAFNRMWTGRMGLLGRPDRGTGPPVAEARVLLEIDRRPGIAARDLSRELGLDEGNLSRLLGRLVRAGWIERSASGVDARRSEMRLTDAGRAALEPLQDTSRDAVRKALGPADASAVACALRAVEEALDPPLVELRELAPGDGGWVIERHGAHYAAHEGFDASFEALVARIVAAFIDGRDPERERCWIAWRGARRIGSIFVVNDGGAAKLRLFYLDPDARGAGIGRHMLETAMGWARERGYGRMRLRTHESHRAAGRLYAAAGFEMTASRPVRSFGRANVEQAWERPL